MGEYSGSGFMAFGSSRVSYDFRYNESGLGACAKRGGISPGIILSTCGIFLMDLRPEKSATPFRFMNISLPGTGEEYL